LNVLISYPGFEDEVKIVEATTGTLPGELSQVLTRERVLDFQGLVKKVPVAENVIRYAVQLVRATRVDIGVATRVSGENGNTALSVPETPACAVAAAQEYLAWGAGPRAAQFLIRGAKTRALLHGRPTPDIEDVQRLTHPVLRHRLVTNFHAEAENMSKDRIIDQVLAEVAL